MKADSYAKLVVLDALVEAEVGYHLTGGAVSPDVLRESLVARLSDLLDDFDALDSVAAGRVYDAIVDFLAELPDHEEGVVEAAVKLRKAVGRVIERGLDRRDLAVASTWAVVLDELLAELADEYHSATTAEGGVRSRPREYTRVNALLERCRIAVDRMLWGAETAAPEVLDEMDRLVYAVRYRRLGPGNVDLIVRTMQRHAARFRPSTLSRIGAFVLRQVMRRDQKRRQPATTASGGTPERKIRVRRRS